MKKILTFLLLISVAQTTAVYAAEKTVDTTTTKPVTTNRQHRPNINPNRPSKQEMKQKFEERLNLTEKQKTQAKKIHEKGKTQMEPIMEKIQAKREEMQALKTSELTLEEKTQTYKQLRTELQTLDKKAQEIRKKNSEEFEKILTKEQKEELAKMKEEGRAKFEKTHPARAPFQGIGNPNINIKPVFKPAKVSE